MPDIDAPDELPAHPLRIFVVENHADTLKWLSRYLESMGHSVESAISMAQAIEKFPQGDYDVIISDIGLPDGDGWTMLRSLPMRHPVYAIAMSGFGTNTDRVKSREVGFRHHFLKPFVPDELDSALDEAMAEIAAR